MTHPVLAKFLAGLTPAESAEFYSRSNDSMRSADDAAFAPLSPELHRKFTDACTAILGYRPAEIVTKGLETNTDLRDPAAPFAPFERWLLAQSGKDAA